MFLLVRAKLNVVAIKLIEAKNSSHTKALQSGLPADKKFSLASDAEAAVKDGRTRWECIRRLQQEN